MAYYMGHEYTPAAARPARYHVGDLVRVVKSGGEEGGRYHGAEVGDTDEIIAVNMTCDSPYEGKIWLYKEHEIVPAFRPGDRVKLNKHYGARACGERGTVSFVNGDRIGVRMDEPTWWGAVAVAMPDGVLDWEREDEQAADCAERNVEQGGDAKPKPKFKAGDVVRALDNCDGQFTKGKTYIVRAYPAEFGHVGVVEDDDGDENGWNEEHFELVSAAASLQDNERPCIVARVETKTAPWGNGTISQPRPSQWPHVHSSVQEATQEAERLARNNPGQEFAVYQRVTARVAEVSYEMKEVA